MKFSVSKEVIQMFEVLEKLPKARRIAYVAMGIPYLISLAALVRAVRWW